MIEPHGGKLINKVSSHRRNVSDLEAVILNKEQVKDVKNIAKGVYSPLEGFLKKEDFQRVVSEMRLSNGTVWPIPIVLDIAEKKKFGEEVALKDEEEKLVAVLKDPEVFSYDKGFFAENVFGTKDRNHPGVEAVYKMGDYLVGGEIELLDNSNSPFPDYNLSPEETRRFFKKKNWEKIVAFQTRNVPHRGHEFLQKEALKRVDGLFVQPVIGEKKSADFKDEYIITSYEVLIDRYYPRDKVLLGILPLKMRYAGPREAVFHAIIRKNFGCSHFIVGRDHAGVGDYYDPFAAHQIFEKFGKDEIGVEIMKFPEVIYCPVGKKHAFRNECPHKEKISFSGTRLREFIQKKEQPPAYLLRPEVYFFLSQSHNSLVDDLYKKNNYQKGFVLWLTGLSQSGKTTTADRVYEILKKKGLRTERLDGDIVRHYLSKDLGFSKKDRDENITRIRYVAKLLSENGMGVIASFISPYGSERKRLREEVENFIEVFCNCPLKVCEERDTKGLYQKARKREITNFTGISDPYEEPENPEIELFTGKETVEENVAKVIDYLKKKNFV